MNARAGSKEPISIDPDHGWLITGDLQTRFGDFHFQGGYATQESAQRLLDLQTLLRAVDVYTTQMMRVSEIATREGTRAFGATSPQHVIIWEELMDAQTLLLTANTETVYALAHLNLKADGPTVIEAPPKMLGFVQDGFQRYLVDIGPLGPDRGAGGAFLILPLALMGKSLTATLSPNPPRTRSCSRCAGSRATAAPVRPLA